MKFSKPHLPNSQKRLPDMMIVQMNRMMAPFNAGDVTLLPDETARKLIDDGDAVGCNAKDGVIQQTHRLGYSVKGRAAA